MVDSIARIEERVRQIQRLLGETTPPNEDFGSELRRASAGSSGHATAPAALQPYVREASAKTGVPEALIEGVISAESGFRTNAVSPVGAQGLMQLMPGTARALGVSDPFDARQNIMGGAEYLRQQLSRFGTVEKALAAYNAGPGAVQKYGGVPPYAETQNYVHRIMSRLKEPDEKSR